jgi:hypothetical protein
VYDSPTFTATAGVVGIDGTPGASPKGADPVLTLLYGDNGAGHTAGQAADNGGDVQSTDYLPRQRALHAGDGPGHVRHHAGHANRHDQHRPRGL